MMEYRKVKEDPSYVREMNSKGVLNVNCSGLEAYKIQRTQRKKSGETINNLKEDVEVLKTDIREIKELLACLLHK